MRPKNPDLSLADLHKLVHYDPDTGVLTRKGKGKPPAISVLGYARLYINGRQLLVHRLAWFYVHGTWPAEIDHINGNRADNRLANLREVTPLQNRMNQTNKGAGKSGMRGVYQDTYSGKWFAKLVVKGKQICSPKCDTPQQARMMWEAIAKQHFGDYLRK